jgi:exodeoxyribonuclease-3
MLIASFNVNSIKARLPNLLEWLEHAKPDVVCLQEVKCLADGFPRADLLAAGYESLVVGQKSYNGVALLANRSIEATAVSLDGNDEDLQARYVEARIDGVRIASIYLPNGNPVSSDKFAYKLQWMARLRRRAEDLLESGEPVVLAGDFNVIPEPEDCHDPAAWADDALYQPASRAALRSIINLGYYDAFRAKYPERERAYTFWDYQQQAFAHDLGIRIDHILLSPEAVDRLIDCRIDREPRGRPRASDHTPILAEIA